MTPDRDDEADSRIAIGQDRLERDVRRVAEYGRAHPEEWVGVRFDNGEEVRVVTAFTDHLDIHRQALRSLVEHPERLTVERQPYSAARLGRIREELQELFDGDERVAVGLQIGWASIMVKLRARGGEEIARQLHERYGDAVSIKVGAPSYPPRPSRGLPPTPEPTVAFEDVALRLELNQYSVPSGDQAWGRLFVRNVGRRALELETGEPMVGVTMDHGRQVVGVYRGPIAGRGRRLWLAPAEEGSVSARVGTASCSSGVGYLLPPGQYLAVVPLHVYGDKAPQGNRFGVLIPAPVTLILT